MRLLFRTTSGVTLIPTKWVYAIKSGRRNKVRLVVQRRNQEKEPQEHRSIFAPVVKWVTTELLIALACTPSLRIYQMDVSSAFCYDDIAVDVYVGTTDDNEVELGWCDQLQKSLYGLRSSPQSWNLLIDKFIKLSLSPWPIRHCYVCILMILLCAHLICSLW